MIKSNKKIYYKYFDLARVSAYLNDEVEFLRANSNLSIIDSNFEKEIIGMSQSELHNLGFDLVSIEELFEYKETGGIEHIQKYVDKLERWLQMIVLPRFFDPKILSHIIDCEKIISKEELINYFKSLKAISIFGKEKSELFSYFVQNMDGANFPLNYRKKYSKDDLVLSHICGAKIRGNFHNHTPYSDGKCTIEELRDMAMLNGRIYIGISDHTKKLKGIDENSIICQHKEIDDMNKLDSDFVILKSVECEILGNGELDLPGYSLKSCDYVIAAVHSDTNMTKSAATKRVLKAVENEYTNILAHPSARLYQKNVGLYLDMYSIIEACISNNVAIEINGDPDRLDLDPKYIQFALEKGAYFTVDSDTHSVEGFRSINNAIRIAEDCHIPPHRILNTYEINEIPLLK
jgi:histidinol phosphatase-like PHP family hydrolase